MNKSIGYIMTDDLNRIKTVKVKLKPGISVKKGDLITIEMIEDPFIRSIADKISKGYNNDNYLLAEEIVDMVQERIGTRYDENYEE